MKKHNMEPISLNLKNKLEFGKVYRISQQEFFRKLSHNLNIGIFITRAPQMSAGNDTLSNQENKQSIISPTCGLW
jgi:hypothetical protein